MVWSIDTEMTGGTMRMIRKEGRVWYLYADGDSQNYTLLTSIESGNADARGTGEPEAGHEPT